MGQLGMQELIVIFVIALLVFGPKKLPELGKSLGKGLREFKRATNDLKATWDDQLRDADTEVRKTARDLQKVQKDVTDDLTRAPAPAASPTPPAPAPEPIGQGTIHSPADPDPGADSASEPQESAKSTGAPADDESTPTGRA